MEETQTGSVKKYHKVHLHYNIWMSTDDGQNVISDERLNLLIAIHQEGTLRAAAQRLGISYRKAWGDLKETEALLGFSLIEKYRGGKDGGLSVLTKEGKILIDAYRVFQIEFQEAVSTIVKKFKRTIKDS